MHKIYFDHRCIAICLPEEIPGASRAETIMTSDDAHRTVEMIKALEGDETIYASGTDQDMVRHLIYNEFKEVNAAGGLVEDKLGRCLLIKRNSLWDLPKGHQEKGEDIEVTALREVEEETGAAGLKLGDLICMTDHCYLRDSIWHLKHTWWYKMSLDSTGDLIPQTEEGITETAWEEKDTAVELMKSSFPSILEVLAKAFGA